MNFYDYKITSDYGMRTHPITGEYKKHNGIDYALPLNTPIYSNVSGEVVKSSYNNSNGNYVVVKDGTGRLHYYLHMNVRTSHIGDKISVGEQLGFSGSTGASTGPHLHYEVKENGVNVNPSSFTTETKETTETNSSVVIPSMDNTAWYDVKGKLKIVVLNIFKFIIIALLIVLFVVFITKALDISIL